MAPLKDRRRLIFFSNGYRENIVSLDDVNLDWLPKNLLDAVSSGVKKINCPLEFSRRMIAIFMADKVVEWGLHWTQGRNNKSVIIAPVMAISNEGAPAEDSYKLSTRNMEVLELVHFTGNHFVIVIEEFVASSGCSRVYGLIIDKVGQLPALNKSIKDYGFMVSQFNLAIPWIIQGWKELRANRDAFNKDLEKRHPLILPKKKRVLSIRANNEPPLKKLEKKKAQLKSDE